MARENYFIYFFTIRKAYNEFLHHVAIFKILSVNSTIRDLKILTKCGEFQSTFIEKFVVIINIRVFVHLR